AHSGSYSGSLSNVRATSINSVNGPFVHVAYFRGSSEGRTTVEPAINGSLIYGSIFSEEAFKNVFDMTSRDVLMFEQGLNPRNTSATSGGEMKIALIVKDFSRPLSITKSSMLYFWGNRSFPSMISGKCFNYTTSNTKRAISLCNVTEMDRCAGNISDLSPFKPFNFLSTTRDRLTQFSWLCPKGQVCCAWECCDLATSSRLDILPAIGSVAFVSFLIGMCVIIITINKEAELNQIESDVHYSAYSKHVHIPPYARYSPYRDMDIMTVNKSPHITPSSASAPTYFNGTWSSR
ncbi:hypothetical protein PFISCL1PPCAC_2489, partial [Pristionchus fissidentatus]